MSAVAGLREAWEVVRPTLRWRRRRSRQEVQCITNPIINSIRINLSREPLVIVKVEVTI